ncbi:MAG TPA: TadE/TadG family type IV pilus assembly protein [Actinomycetes bacterium]|jgi:Flp pilus assembly protein TadG|nr:TadE/TadG family type IV pilus assembly protein [Actinomycetes bacterium]
MATGTPPRERERGSAAVEAAVVAPALLLFILLVVLGGRVASAKLRVEEAARDAARAASIAGNAGQAAAEADSTARASLGNAGVTCASFSVQPDLGGFRPGGSVRVTVRCTTPLGELAPLPVPGSKTLSASYLVVIDPFRSR